MNNPFEQLQNQLSDLQRQISSQPTNNGPEWFNADQAADYLNVKKSTLYKKTMRGEVPFHKTGKKLMFKKSDLVNFLEAGRYEPAQGQGIKIEK